MKRSNTCVKTNAFLLASLAFANEASQAQGKNPSACLKLGIKELGLRLTCARLASSKQQVASSQQPAASRKRQRVGFTCVKQSPWRSLSGGMLSHKSPKRCNLIIQPWSWFHTSGDSKGNPLNIDKKFVKRSYQIEIQWRIFFILFSFVFTFWNTYMYSKEYIYLFSKSFDSYHFIFTDISEGFQTYLELSIGISIYLSVPFILYHIICFFFLV